MCARLRERLEPRRDKKGWSFFHFPLENQALLEKWQRNISRQDFKPGPGHRVCSEHFEVDAFQRDLRGELLAESLPTTGIHYRRRKQLKENAVPPIFPARRPKAHRRTSSYIAQKEHQQVRNSKVAACVRTLACSVQLTMFCRSRKFRCNLNFGVFGTFFEHLI